MLLLTGPNYSGKSVYMKQVRKSRDFEHGGKSNDKIGCSDYLSCASWKVRDPQLIAKLRIGLKAVASFQQRVQRSE